MHNHNHASTALHLLVYRANCTRSLSLSGCQACTHTCNTTLSQTRTKSVRPNAYVLVTFMCKYPIEPFWFWFGHTLHVNIFCLAIACIPSHRCIRSVAAFVRSFVRSSVYWHELWIFDRHWETCLCFQLLHCFANAMIAASAAAASTVVFVVAVVLLLWRADFCGLLFSLTLLYLCVGLTRHTFTLKNSVCRALFFQMHCEIGWKLNFVFFSFHFVHSVAVLPRFHIKSIDVCLFALCFHTCWDSTPESCWLRVQPKSCGTHNQWR